MRLGLNTDGDTLLRVGVVAVRPASEDTGRAWKRVPDFAAEIKERDARIVVCEADIERSIDIQSR